jgi:serine/threonine protein kinase
VTDFGLARSVLGPDEGTRSTSPATPLHADLTATGTVLGTPRYMPPEQLTGPDIDARADQFSFCVALYEALYGVHPLPGATSVSMLEKHEKAHPPPEGSKVPAAIERAVMTGLERDRAKRFPTIGALISALVPAPKRTPVRYVALGLAGVMAVGVALAAIRPVEEPPPPPGGDPIGPLVVKINELQDQLKQRDAENHALVAELNLRQPDVQRIQQLQNEIALRDDKIEQLVHEVAELKGARLPPRPTPGQEELARGAFDRAHADLESCLGEWSRRQSGNADLSFKMTASADGVGHDVEPLQSTAADDRIGPSLRTCVGGVLERVQFTPGPNNLDLNVYIQWDADVRSVGVSARVVARRKATKMLDH